jgi:hypothetical protein
MQGAAPSAPSGVGRWILFLQLWILAVSLQQALSKECFPARNGNAVLRKAVVVRHHGWCHLLAWHFCANGQLCSLTSPVLARATLDVHESGRTDTRDPEPVQAPAVDQVRVPHRDVVHRERHAVRPRVRQPIHVQSAPATMADGFGNQHDRDVRWSASFRAIPRT